MQGWLIDYLRMATNQLATRAFACFNLPALWRSRLSARMPESQNYKWSVTQPAWRRIP